MVDASSAVLGPAFALRFESSDMREWAPRCVRDQLATCLHELAQLDPGSEELWVVGVLGDTPRWTSSFETLGRLLKQQRSRSRNCSVRTSTRVTWRSAA